MTLTHSETHSLALTLSSSHRHTYWDAATICRSTNSTTVDVYTTITIYTVNCQHTSRCLQFMRSEVMRVISLLVCSSLISSLESGVVLVAQAITDLQLGSFANCINVGVGFSFRRTDHIISPTQK